MNTQTKQIVLYAAIIGAAVASVTTAVVLLVNRKRKKLARTEPELVNGEFSSEEADLSADEGELPEA